MNGEIFCIVNEKKKKGQEWMVKWPLWLFSTLFSVYKKLAQFFFHTLQANLFKQRYILFIY